MRLVGRRYDNQKPIWIDVKDDRISEIGTWHGDASEHLPWIAPGLVDLQVNGFAGQEFTEASLSHVDVEAICRAMDIAGVTRFLATVTTQAHPVMVHALDTISSAMRDVEAVGNRIAGIHLEGPFISAEDGPRGAHPKAHCQTPAWDLFLELQDAARGQIRMLTLSPEYPGSAEFIRRVVDTDVLVAIGHTSANSAQIQAAVAAGARISTHLGNGAHARIPRHPNYIWDQLADDRLIATLIVDGHHLPAEVVKCFVRVKTPNRVVLISDIAGLAGLPPGIHETVNQGTVEVSDDHIARLADRPEYLAGATLPLSFGISNVMRFADVTLADAIDMASGHAARLLGLPASCLEVGAIANLFQFEMTPQASPIQVLATINHGQCVYGQPRCAEDTAG